MLIFVVLQLIKLQSNIQTHKVGNNGNIYMMCRFLGDFYDVCWCDGAWLDETKCCAVVLAYK